MPRGTRQKKGVAANSGSETVTAASVPQPAGNQRRRSKRQAAVPEEARSIRSVASKKAARGIKLGDERPKDVESGKDVDESETEVDAPKAKKAKQSRRAPAAVEKQMGGRSSQTVKVISWNVAGIRAWIKKKAHQILKDESPDIFGVQETKCSSLPEEMNVKGYHHFIESPAGKAGHSGVLLLTKSQPLKVTLGSEMREAARGRLIVVEYEKFYLINSYVPNSGQKLVNLDKRKEWDTWFYKELKKLDAKKPVIYAGDLNVAHAEIDLANPKTNRNKTAGFTDQERDAFTRLLDAGFVDVYRKLNPEQEGAYTFWSIRHGGRPRNIGWRLDYFVVSERIFNNVVSCRLLSDVEGSDHCPIALEIAL